MAKIKHNNFLDTVNDVISNATNAGVLHLNAEGEALNGRRKRFLSHWNHGLPGVGAGSSA